MSTVARSAALSVAPALADDALADALADEALDDALADEALAELADEVLVALALEDEALAGLALALAELTAAGLDELPPHAARLNAIAMAPATASNTSALLFKTFPFRLFAPVSATPCAY